MPISSPSISGILRSWLYPVLYLSLNLLRHSCKISSYSTVSSVMCVFITGNFVTRETLSPF